MRRLLFILAALLVGLSVTGGAVSHAMEPSACLDASTAASLGHSTGDGDQVPADVEKGYVHHHGGCHGHQMAETVEAPRLEPYGENKVVNLSNAPRVLPSATADPALRPPIA